MATQVKHRRGNTTEINNFTPAVAEIIVNTEDYSLTVGDGVTQGGKKVSRGVESKTLSEAVSSVTAREGDTVIISDRGNGLFEYTTGQTANGYNIVATLSPLLFLVLRIEGDSVTSKNIGTPLEGDAQPALTNLLGITNTNVRALIKEDVELTNPLLISTSTQIEGTVKDKGNKIELRTTGTSGVSIDKTFVGGVDENIIAVSIKDIKVYDTTQSKEAGTYGVLANRVNKELRLDGVEAHGFEKGVNLKGVIGGSLYSVGCAGNKYGLYTESNNDVGLPAYDCTNTNFYHGVFNANETGVYLGALTQGLNFYGTNIERNTVVGLDLATTAPAGSCVNFFGGWFEANPVAVRFTEKPKTVTFSGVYFFDNVELWDNNGGGNIDARFERCKIESSHINLDMFEGSFVDNDCINCTFTATTPNAYQCAEWRGVNVSVDDGNTLLTTRRIGNGRYAVEAIGSPKNTALADGSTWLDVSEATMYTRKNDGWFLYEKYLIDERSADFPSVPANGSTSFGPYTLTGAEEGDFVEVFMDTGFSGLVVSPYVNAKNQITIELYNNGSTAVDLPIKKLRTKVLR